MLLSHFSLNVWFCTEQICLHLKLITPGLRYALKYDSTFFSISGFFLPCSYTLSGVILGKLLTSSLLFLRLCIICRSVSLHVWCRHICWFPSPTACIIHILNYMLHVCFTFVPAEVSIHLNAEARTLPLLYLAAYKANPSQIYDSWYFIDGSQFTAVVCAISALNSNLRSEALRTRQGSCKKKPSIFSWAHLLFCHFFPAKEREREKKAPLCSTPPATFITAFHNYSTIIKQQTFNHSLCLHDKVVHNTKESQVWTVETLKSEARYWIFVNRKNCAVSKK